MFPSRNVSVTSEIVYTVFYGIVLVSTIVGNILVCVVVHKTKQLQTFTTYLLVSLAASDLMVGVFGAIHLVTAFAAENGAYPTKVCRALDAIIYLSAALSIYSLVLISVERYLAIVKPFTRRRRISLGLLKFIIPGVWICAAVVVAPMFYFLISSDFTGQEFVCWETLTLKSFEKPYKYFLFVALYLLPMTVLTFLYGGIIRRLWFRSKTDKGTNIAILRSRRRLTKMLGCVIIVFNFCWLPWCVTEVISASTVWLRNSSLLLFQLLSLFAVANSSANVFIYSLQSRKFRQGARSVLFCFKRHKKNVGMQNIAMNEIQRP